MEATAPSYEQRRLYGPFHRLLAEESQDAATVVRQVLSGEVWGTTAQHGRQPQVKAYRGPLREGQEGIEFWTFEQPDRPWGSRLFWSREGPYATIEDEFVKLSVLFARVTQELVDDA